MINQFEPLNPTNAPILIYSWSLPGHPICPAYLVISFVNKKLLGTGRRSNRHLTHLLIIFRVITQIFTRQPVLISSNRVNINNRTELAREGIPSRMRPLKNYLSGWNRFTKQSIDMLTMSALQ